MRKGGKGRKAEERGDEGGGRKEDEKYIYQSFEVLGKGRGEING